MVDVTPGDSGANKGFWRQQLRDRYGRFLDMGGKVLFEVQIPGVSGTVRARGTVKDVVGEDTVLIEVADNKLIPRGNYEINRKFVENETTDNNTADAPAKGASPAPDTARKPETTSELRSSISGHEALNTRMKSIAQHLKSKGRFPIPRIGSNAQAGKNTDVANGARLDYQKVFDNSPAVQEQFKTFENMWDYVGKNGTDLTTQSPNELKDIPEEMKLLNREYAKHVLGMEPDGLLTVYRNAVNGKDTEQESAIGYVSLDSQMAYDYNSHRENIGANGRYEIDVKPDEVYGLIGYSRIEDEYGLTIGREVANIPGRVRRVGDLKPAELPDWLQEWNDSFKRGQGQSPLRAFGLAGQYDFHKVEDFGANLQEFLEKYNLQAPDIAAKFDELYGEGAYANYKASGNSINFAEIKKLFVDLGDGQIGVNLPYLEEFNILKDNDQYTNDALDNRLKMLSVFQELTGQHFMTHKTRDYTPPKFDNQTGIFKEYSPDNSSSAAEDTPLTDLGFDPEQEITVYRGVPSGASDINPGDWVTTLPELAKDYAGDGGKVISVKVKAKDLLTDPSVGEDAYTEEMVYRPK